MRNSFLIWNRISVVGAIAILLATAIPTYAESSVETRAPSEHKDLDWDNNGKLDAYTEHYTLSKDLIVKTYERLNEDAQTLKGRATSIKFQGKEIWSEVYIPSLRERTTTVAQKSPFQISMITHAKSSTVTLALNDGKAHLVAALVSEKDGRFAPVTEKERDRMQKVGQAVANFFLGVLDQADELNASENASSKSH